MFGYKLVRSGQSSCYTIREAFPMVDVIKFHHQGDLLEEEFVVLDDNVFPNGESITFEIYEKYWWFGSWRRAKAVVVTRQGNTKLSLYRLEDLTVRVTSYK
ncbi:MAG: hypothetical protein ABIQ04_01605 [Candidatus Saccharimonadales bacterium]